MNTKKDNKRKEKKMFMQKDGQDLKTQRDGIVALACQANEEADYVESLRV